MCCHLRSRNSAGMGAGRQGMHLEWTSGVQAKEV